MDRRFGFIHDKLDIKILILFILRRLTEPVDMETLTELTLCDDGISYFDFAECVSDLVRTEHIREEDGRFSITEKGSFNGAAVETSLPYSVRMKAEKSASDLAAVQKRDSMISASSTVRRRGGCTVSLSLSDGVGPLLSMDVLAPDQGQADRIEKNFRANAERIYIQIMELLMKE